MDKIILPFEDKLPCAVCRFSDLQPFLIPCRAASRIPENAESVIVWLFPYYLGERYYSDLNISKYAVSPDYHSTVLGYLNDAAARLKERYPDNAFEPFCDNSPIPEVYAALRAGLGVKGKNGLLINPVYGSFCFIGEIVTDLKLSAADAGISFCPGCGACEKHCPSGAVCKEGLAPEKCVSAITQKKGELTIEEKTLIKANGSVWGCDGCQDVCPLNRDAAVTPLTEFFVSVYPHYDPAVSFDNRAYSWRPRNVIDRNFQIIYCNDGENKI